MHSFVLALNLRCMEVFMEVSTCKTQKKMQFYPSIFGLSQLKSCVDKPTNLAFNKASMNRNMA